MVVTLLAPPFYLCAWRRKYYICDATNLHAVPRPLTTKNGARLLAPHAVNPSPQRTKRITSSSNTWRSKRRQVTILKPWQKTKCLFVSNYNNKLTHLYLCALRLTLMSHQIFKVWSSLTPDWSASYHSAKRSSRRCMSGESWKLSSLPSVPSSKTIALKQRSCFKLQVCKLQVASCKLM